MGLSLLFFSSFIDGCCARTILATSAIRTKVKYVRIRIELPPVCLLRICQGRAIIERIEKQHKSSMRLSPVLGPESK